MRVPSFVRLLLGSFAVYLSVATLHACRTDVPDMLAAAAGGSGGASGTGPANSATSGKSGSAGALMNPVPNANAEESGSRLKAKWRVGDDGSRQFAGWWDSVRGEDCGFSSLVGPVARCTPSALSSVSSFYIDAACSKNGAVLFGACPQVAPKYIMVQSDACGATYKLHAAGPIVMQPALYQKDAAGACQKSILAVAAAYEIGVEIPSSAFVASTITTDP